MSSKSKIEILSEIGKKPNQAIPLYKIAERLDWSEGHASRVVSELEARDFVRTEREGGRKFVSPSDIQPVEELSSLTGELPHVDVSDLISGSAMDILFYLNEDRTATEIAELSQKSRNTVYRRLNALQNVGIVGKDHSRYQLTEPFSSLSDLARSIAHHEHRQEALDLAESVTIIWETHDEYLFSCESEFKADGFLRTGPSVFEEFGIALFTRERSHYFRSDRLSDLSASDLVCHTLLIDDSTRYRSYCLLLIESEDIDRSTLLNCASHYTVDAEIQLETLVDDLITYLETQGDVRDEQFPGWEYFKRTAADYDISV